MVTEIIETAVENLQPHPWNPRGPIEPTDPAVVELANSIRALGILEPLVATPAGVIVCGHRRHAAAKSIGLRTVPVVVRDLTEREQIEAALAENIQREALTPLQEARAYKRMIDGGYTQADVARRLGLQHARVFLRLAILKLAPEVQNLFDRAELPITAAVPLGKVGDWGMQRRLAIMSARRSLKVPQLEALVARHLEEFTQAARAPKPDPEPDPARTLRDTRADVIARLEKDAERAVSFAQIGRLLADTCCACGMETMPAVCDACPLSQFVGKLLGKAR
jgi:ParB family chromosome partitioning protein